MTNDMNSTIHRDGLLSTASAQQNVLPVPRSFNRRSVRGCGATAAAAAPVLPLLRFLLHQVRTQQPVGVLDVARLLVGARRQVFEVHVVQVLEQPGSTRELTSTANTSKQGIRSKARSVANLQKPKLVNSIRENCTATTMHGETLTKSGDGQQYGAFDTFMCANRKWYSAWYGYAGCVKLDYLKALNERRKAHTHTHHHHHYHHHHHHTQTFDPEDLRPKQRSREIRVHEAVGPRRMLNNKSKRGGGVPKRPDT